MVRESVSGGSEEGDGGRGEGDSDRRGGRERDKGGGLGQVQTEFAFGHSGDKNHQNGGDWKAPFPASRRVLSTSYKDKLLSLGHVGFLITHDEEEDIVNGWRTFFAKQGSGLMRTRKMDSEGDEVERANSKGKYLVLSDNESIYCVV